MLHVAIMNHDSQGICYAMENLEKQYLPCNARNLFGVFGELSNRSRIICTLISCGWDCLYMPLWQYSQLMWCINITPLPEGRAQRSSFYITVDFLDFWQWYMRAVNTHVGLGETNSLYKWLHNSARCYSNRSKLFRSLTVPKLDHRNHSLILYITKCVV